MGADSAKFKVHYTGSLSTLFLDDVNLANLFNFGYVYIFILSI